MSPLKSQYEDGGTTKLTGRARMSLKPNLGSDEHVILHSQGGYKDNVRPIWKLGQFYLTSKRLIFSVPTHVIWEVPLSNIKRISVEQQRYIAGRVKAMIAIGYQNPINQRLSKAWIIMPELETWKKELYGRALLKIDQEMLDSVLEQLDSQSQELVSYLIDIVTDLTGSGITEEDITLRIAGDRVILSAEDEKYYEEIILPGEVNTDECMRTCHNNILALSLQKLRCSDSTDKR